VKSALEIHEYYARLFRAFETLPSADIRSELSFGNLFATYQKGEYREYKAELERLKCFLESSNLTAERKEIITDFLEVHFPLAEKQISFPECRHFLVQRDRLDLRERLFELLNGPNMGEGQLWAAGIPAWQYHWTIAELEQNARLTPDKDSRARIEVIKKCLALLDEQREGGVSEASIPFPQRTFSYPEPSTCGADLGQPASQATPTTAAPGPPTGPFAPLLLNYTVAELTELLAELGLLDTATGRATPAASPGAWVGVVHGLLSAPRPRLRSKLAAIGRALVDVFGAKVSESALQAGVSKRGSESERVRDRTLALLAARTIGD
jgi:hypothetical protein